ncbi:hypothetical protein Fot_32414 [Forsythia ovata]|uniref:Uncharacterized protein n=1 Tax=Forsythia ovata TaxID=205694 RepID=A0ABD1T7Q5_9LAMI
MTDFATEEAADLQKQREESLRQRKRKGVASPSGAGPNFSVQSSSEVKLTAAKEFEEAEKSVLDLELNRRNANTALCHTKIIKDWDHFQERATWLHRSLNELKKELRLATDERDKLKADLQVAEFDVAEFFKRYDHATRAQELTAKALEEVNKQKNGVVEKVAELENALDSLKSENSSLKEENLRLERGTEVAVKARVENFINQFEFTSDYENL